MSLAIRFMKAYAIYCRLNQCLALPFYALCQFDTENIFLSLVNFKCNSAIRLLLFYSKFNSHTSINVFIYIKIMILIFMDDATLLS
jgi:hypothetical protein